jgi:hypothetical protein
MNVEVCLMKALKTAALVTVIVSSTLAFLRGGVPAVQSGGWTEGASATNRTGAAATLLSDGRVLVTGGISAGGVVSSVDVFSETEAVAAGAALNVPRAEHAVVLLSNDSVLAIGGRNADGSTASVEIYINGGWTTVGSLTNARWGHTATLLKDGRVLVAGGENESGPVANIEVFDPVSGEFSMAGTLSAPRTGHAAARLQDGRVFIAGGFDGRNALASIDIYDPSSGTVADGGTLTVARAGLSATTLLDGRVLLFGGFDGEQELASADVFDPATGLSSVTGDASAPRRDHQAFLLPANNSVLVVGGISSGAPSASAELYLPWAGEFRATGRMTVARANATGTALVTRGKLLVNGGENGTGPIGSSEVYAFATLETDRNDYAPGTTVTITGHGWQPGETVRLLLQEVTPEHPDRLITVVADDDGNIFDDSFAPEEHHLGVRFYLTATGAGSQAQTTFTDSRTINSVTLNGGTSVTVAPAATITVVINVTTDNGGGTQNWRATSWRIANSTGTGSCVDHILNHDGVGTYTETFTIPAPAAAGIYNAYFVASGNDNCSNQLSETKLLPNSVTVVVPDNTAPTTTVTLGPVTPNGNNDWYTSNVHLTVSATDNAGGSGVTETRCVLDPASAPASFDDISIGCAYLGAGADVMSDGSHIVYAASRDEAGNKESVISTSFKIDKTPPQVTATPVRGSDENGWYNHALTVTYSGTDEISGLAGCDPAESYSGSDSPSATLTGTCSDKAGNSASGSYSFKYDATAPANVSAAAARTPDHNDWYNHAVTITWNGQDVTSGIASCTSTTYSGPDNAAASADGHCTDQAGNASADVAFSFKYDGTAPVVTATPDRAADHDNWYNHALTVTFAGTDGTSGPVSCDSAASYSGPDSATATVSGSCADQAGNSASAGYNFKYDATAPTNVNATAGRVPDHNGWYNHALTIAWTGTDTTSGIATCTQTSYSGPDDGAAAKSGKCSDHAGNQSADVVFSFKYDATAPDVTATPDRAPDHNDWYNHGLTVTFSASDLTSGVAGCDSAAAYSGPDSGTATVSGNCSDEAGNPASAAYAFKYDATAPTNVTATADRGADQNGWYNHGLTITWSGDDATSGVASCSATAYNAPDNAAASVNGLCHDQAGNASATVAFAFRYDATAPTLAHNTAGDLCSVPGNGEWCRGTQTAAFVAHDATSGVATPCVGNSCGFTNWTATNGVAVTIPSGSASDVAGNVAAGVNAGPYKIDSVAPGITFSTPAAGSPYLLNQSVPAVFSCTDSGSGFAGGNTVAGPSAGCAGAAHVNTTSVGAGKVFAATATDVAGNSAASAVSYAVQFGVCALYDETKAVKQNATVPIKLALCDANGANHSSPGVVLHALSVTPESGTLTGVLDDAGQANPDYDFRHNGLTGGNGGYIFNLSTKAIPPGVWRLLFSVSGDPVTHSVRFGVR